MKPGTSLWSRIEKLERAAGQSQGGRVWNAPIVECQAGDDISGQVAAIRRDALAAGWLPESRLPVVVVVELPGDETETG